MKLNLQILPKAIDRKTTGILLTLLVLFSAVGAAAAVTATPATSNVGDTSRAIPTISPHPTIGPGLLKHPTNITMEATPHQASQHINKSFAVCGRLTDRTTGKGVSNASIKVEYTTQCTLSAPPELWQWHVAQTPVYTNSGGYYCIVEKWTLRQPNLAYRASFDGDGQCLSCTSPIIPVPVI